MCRDLSGVMYSGIAAGGREMNKKKYWYDYLWIWTIGIPWGWTYTAGMVPDWIAQFSFGFYSLMLTSTLIGLIVMVLYKPRTWCSFCPMGTMTQGICKIKNRH